MPLSPLAGRALRFAIRDGRHERGRSTPALRGLDRYLDEHRDELRAEARRQVAVVAAGRRRGPHLRAPARRRPRGASARWPSDREHDLRRRSTPAWLVLADDLEHDPADLRAGASSSSTTCSTSPSCGRGSPRCGPTPRRSSAAQAADPDVRAAPAAAGAIVAAGPPAPATTRRCAAKVERRRRDGGALRRRALPAARSRAW